MGGEVAGPRLGTAVPAPPAAPSAPVPPGLRAASRAGIRARNLSALLRTVHLHGPRSRSELTELIGVNRSTIGVLVATLAEAGLVGEQPGAGSGRAGRPSQVVTARADARYALAVDLRVRQVVAARVGLGGGVQQRLELPAPDGGIDRAVAVVAQACARLREAAPPAAACVGVGVAVPGMVGGGVARLTPNLGWVDVPLADELTRRLGLPVRIDNEADLGVLAEQLRGAAVGADYVVYLSGEVGVGAGVISGGRPLRGVGGYAGEIGHIMVNPRGVPCRCGSRGCLETEIGAEALLRAAGRPPGGGAVAAAGVLAAARQGEAGARMAVARVAGWLGRGLALLVNTFNPALVLVGGPLGALYRAATDTVTAAYTEAALPAPREQARIALPAFGEDSTLLGAAELVFTDLLEDPLAPSAA